MNLPTILEPRRKCESALVQLRLGATKPMADWLREHLFGHVLPFWERYSLDAQGGILTCLNDAGEIISTDKWLWSQWRAVWVFSRIYNEIDRDLRWLNHAIRIADFCTRTGWDEQAKGWVLVVSRDGKVLRGCESTYVDAFAVYGLTELYRATRNDDTRQLACKTADAAMRKLSHPHDTIPHFPYPIPRGTKPHGIPMLWSLSLAELGHALQDEKYLTAAAQLSDNIFHDFYRPSRDLCLELVQADGREYSPPAGTAVVPGHVIEDMWFQVHVAKLTRRQPVDIEEMLRLVLRHLKLGWDLNQGGGILLAVDADGRESVGWSFADTKLWWPHTEALYATLLGARRTGRPAFLEWYERLWRLCLDHYVDWKHGEWRQKLDRSLAPLNGVIALPVKDPFHLPRSLILQIELLEKGL